MIPLAHFWGAFWEYFSMFLFDVFLGVRFLLFFVTFWLHFGGFWPPTCTLILHLWAKGPPEGTDGATWRQNGVPKLPNGAPEVAKWSPKGTKWSPKVPKWNQKGTPKGPEEAKAANMWARGAPKLPNAQNMMPTWSKNGTNTAQKVKMEPEHRFRTKRVGKNKEERRRTT